MYKRIPYFGENSNEIMEMINDVEAEEEYRCSLYDFVLSHLENDTVFVIKDYVYSYVSDIKFNYRDKECYVPYFDFDLYATEVINDNRGHLIVKNGKRQIRYNFKSCKLDIKLNHAYTMFSISQRKKFKVIFTSYYTGIFSINRLYQLYLDSCYKDDNYVVLKHESGYHYINQKTSTYKNLEKNLRRKYKLPDYAEQEQEKDYRDVREYTYMEVMEKIGIFANTELYKIRRLRFEAYLYCSLREDLVPDDCPEWQDLGTKYNYLKIKETIPLFIKSYWLNKPKKQVKYRTYMRMEKWHDTE